MSEYRLNIEEIRRFLPHRSPFLLVDRVLEVHPVGADQRIAEDLDAVTIVPPTDDAPGPKDGGLDPGGLGVGAVAGGEVGDTTG